MKRAFIVAALLAAATILLAFVIAPSACKGGLEIYFWSGCVALLAFVALPFVTPVGHSMLARFSCSVGFLILGGAVWLLGLIVADVRFICGMGYL